MSSGRFAPSLPLSSMCWKSSALLVFRSSPRLRLSAQDARLKDAVHALPGALPEPAAGDCIRDPAVARELLPEDILRGDAGREPAGADDLQPPRVLADEDRATQPVLSVRHRIE